MKVTYIKHSGFAVELPGKTLLFDYYEPLWILSRRRIFLVLAF